MRLNEEILTILKLTIWEEPPPPSPFQNLNLRMSSLTSNRTKLWKQHFDPPYEGFSQARETKKTPQPAHLRDHPMLVFL